MDILPRREPPRTGSEKEMLESFLDFHRATFMIKVQGLSEEAARQSMAPSALTMAKLLKHIAGAELFWFQFLFAGLDIEVFSEESQWLLEESDTLESLLAFYTAQIEKSKEIVAACDDLNTLAKRNRFSEEPPSLRYIMLHLIEETARHNGHLDIFRERLDGSVGE